jgi:ABC-type transporter Mla subunit MlaD
MALFEIDPDQFAQLDTRFSELTHAITSLSENVGKWQAQQTVAIQSGLAGLIAAVTGADIEEIQKRINQFADQVNQSSDKVEDATNQQKGS